MSLTKKIVTYTLLASFTLIMMFPILYAFLISFMQGGEVLQGKLWPESFSFDNYISAFEKVPLLTYLLNSLIVSTVIMIGVLAVSSLAAFAFVFINFKGRDILFYLFISTMMIPWEAAMVPNFQTVQALGWLNSYAGLTIPFFALAFGTFLLRQQFKTIPHELYEASQVSGISRFRFFYKIALPVSKTSMVTLGIYSFLTAWNMYLWPLLVTNNEAVRTVQIGLKQMQSQEISTEWGVVMAGVVIVILPTLVLLFLGQKRLQEGLTQGAIK
ncbi:carbohydrate ABC transporter permease [Jeotgalibacillus soli]|uniref:Glycerol-3-phosphate ABC transporter permease n=1 Tax=Jeotgalibacillus soli TaxID=889306 RepID=A0A0C2VM67_9BACL|nr:carbohydrate ABC transporter permease [Jeotgalibacillus soli]KIL45098.1 glycerol-3-phosphate ABC transporter permease [Jeotgalibacillus soli]